MVFIGAALPIASIARRSSHGMTLVIAEDARTMTSPTLNEIQYGR
jgi:hypothetical protein